MPAVAPQESRLDYSPEATASLVYGTVLDSQGSHESWETLRNAALRLLIGEGAGQEKIRTVLAALRQHALDEVSRSIDRREAEIWSYDVMIRGTSRELLTLIDYGETPRPGHHVVRRLRGQLTRQRDVSEALARSRAVRERLEAVEL